MEDLHKLYPEALPNIPISMIKGTPVDKRVAHFCKALTYIRDSWMVRFRYDRTSKMENTNGEQLVDIAFATFDYMTKAARELFDILEDEELKNDYSSVASTLKQSYSYSSKPARTGIPGAAPPPVYISKEMVQSTEPPVMPSKGSVPNAMPPSKGLPPPPPPRPPPPEMPSKGLVPNGMPLKNAPAPPPLPIMPSKGSVPNAMPLGKGPPPPPPPPGMPLGTGPPSPPPPPPPQSGMRLKGSTPNGLPLGNVPAPPPPPMMPSKGSTPNSMQLKKGPPPPPPPLMPSQGSVPNAMPLKSPGPPPPPQLGAGKSLFQKRPTTKLKRSTQMPNLFRDLRSKMEGSSLTVKTTNARKVQLGGSKGGKEGLAASLAEITKRSTYFQQIEDDIKKYSKSMMELKADINSFQTKDMMKLLKFQSNVESILQDLTDESQVLAKFEGFPSKKLETLRTAAALYSKFDTIVATLKNWEIVPPLGQLLDKVEKYLSKIKLELDAFERNKDEESKKFKSHSIEFDFNLVTKIKELMVDLSSSCMELALKERRESKAGIENEERTGAKADQKAKESIKILWRVFQLAFRVYSFAGGQDDRAEKLAKELADEILFDSPNL